VPEQDRANALLQQGIERAKAGEIDEAMRLFDEALDVVPENPVVNYNRGLAQQQVGSIEAAIVAYRAATEVLPDFTEAWINLSHALKLLGRFSAAQEAAEKAIQLDAGLPSAWLAKGNALRGRHALGQAAEAFRRGVEVAPADGELKVSLAKCRRRSSCSAKRLASIPSLLRHIATWPMRCCSTASIGRAGSRIAGAGAPGRCSIRSAINRSRNGPASR